MEIILTVRYGSLLILAIGNVYYYTHKHHENAFSRDHQKSHWPIQYMTTRKSATQMDLMRVNITPFKDSGIIQCPLHIK